MTTIAVLATLATASTLIVAALVGLFVAYPLRHREVPHAPWLSQPLERIRDNLDPIMEWSSDGAASGRSDVTTDTTAEAGEHHTHT